MAQYIQLEVTGTFSLFIKKLKGSQEYLPEDDQLEIGEKLKKGDYVISMNDKVIYDLNDMENALYHFDLEPEETEYTFDDVYYDEN